MGFFNFIETFFFISLGITFVLILLLVYHFKQRMSSLEQKCDTMFEIINNMVKELTMLRAAQAQQRQFGFSPATLDELYNSMEPRNNKVLVSDNENGDQDDSDSETSGSQYETGDSEDEGEDSEEEEIEQGPIKIVNVNISEKMDIEEIDGDNGDVDNDGDNELNNSGIEPIEVDELHVEKLGSTEPIVEDAEDSTSVTSNNKDVYKKMALSALKTIAITKGLCSDASKLKKSDILKLLEDSE